MGFFSRIRDALQSQPDDAPRSGVEAFDVRGFTVYVENTRPDIETAAVIRRLDEALGLIERTQPWRLAHMRRDLSHFLVIRYACRGAFFPDQRACMTELTFLARTDITVLVQAKAEQARSWWRKRYTKPAVAPSDRSS